MGPVSVALVDGVAIARRNAIRIRRSPDQLVVAVVQPLVMMIMFGYVFGGSIDVPGGDYRAFLAGGLFALILTLGAATTGTGLADDLRTGLIDRFRILPVARSAVVVGRTLSDVGLNAVSLVVLALTGLVVGWRIEGSAVDAALAVGLLLLFSYALSWVMAYIGLRFRSSEVINQVSTTVLFPLTFIANTVVPADDLPWLLRTASRWNPISSLTQATRELFGNIPLGTPEPSGWAMQHPVAYSLAWAVAVLVVFVPLTVRRYGAR